MQLFADKVRIYAGAGVTVDSDPKDEWQETEMKMDNLKKLFY
jgi:isochorismate synthase EntC